MTYEQPAGKLRTLSLKPVFVKKIWGGRRLHDDFGYQIPDGPVGECWAISAHPHGDCEIVGGPYAGEHLSDLWRDHRELFGGAPGDCFPLLIKILDARDNLSVQVHPDDAYAAEHENGSLGKRECWYVLDADPNERIIVGQRAKDRADFAQMVKDGRWDDLLNYVPIRKGDFFPIEPGTLHAIMGGTLILETQQSSDVTYRVYDFDRKDTQGRTRELHIKQALDCVDYQAEAPTSGTVTAPEKNGITHLLHNPNFDVLHVNVRGDAPVSIDQRWDYLCMSVVEGSGTLEIRDAAADADSAETRQLRKGDHLIVLSGAGNLRLSGQMELVCSYVER